MKYIIALAFQLALWGPQFGIVAQTSGTDKPNTPESAAKAKAIKLLNSVVEDSSALKLWENRALVQGVAGDILWDTDQKAARKLFQEAEQELSNGILVKTPTSGDFRIQFTDRSRFTSRRTVLLTISARDAALALEIFYRTRPVETQTALDRSKAPKIEGAENTQIEMETAQREQRAVNEENSLEQMIVKSSIDQDPKKAAEAIRASLSQGVTNETVNLLKKVNEFDADLAAEICTEVIKKLLETDFTKENSPGLYTAQYLLSEADKASKKGKNEKRGFPVPPKSELESLSNKIADVYLARTNLNSLWNLSSNVDVLKKYSPGKASSLTAKVEELAKDGPDYLKASLRADEFLKDESKTPKELVAAARDYSTWQKSQLYEEAVERASARKDLMDLRSMLKSEDPGEERDNAINKVDEALSKKAIDEGDLNAVRELIDTADNDLGRLKLLVSLAQEFYKKGDKDSKDSAVKLMDEASSLVGRNAEDAKDAESMLLIASGFAEIRPDTALVYLEGLTTMTNDLLLADSLRAKYDKLSARFVEGEVIFTQYVFRSYSTYAKPLATLAKSDFEGVLSLVDRIDRDDIKTLMRLLLVQAVTTEKMGFEGNRVASYGFFSIN